jgi:hypothetical protein
MMSRILRVLGLTALFTVTTCAVLLLIMLLGGFLHDWNLGWGFHRSGQRLVSYLQLFAYATRSSAFAAPPIWITAAGALYLLAQGAVSSGAIWRTVRASIGLTLGWFALAFVERSLWPALAQTMSPFDRPLLSAPLFLYILAAPWLLGRLERRGPVKISEV